MINYRLRFFSIFTLFLFMVFAPFSNAVVGQVTTSLNPPKTIAGQAVVMDFDTREILYNKNADELVPPSSMSKLMTIYVLFDKIKQGKFTLNDEFKITNLALVKSRTMERERGSHMGIHKLTVNDVVKVEDLIKGIIVLSGNDACVVVAENVSGSEEAFVMEMMEYAKKLGMNHTYLKNASGWEMDGHLMSVKDLAILSEHLIRDFPEYYHYFSLRQFIYDEKVLWNSFNRNELLRTQVGADGLKTGHTDKGGYSITSSIRMGDRRLIVVVNGIMPASGMTTRFNEVKKLFNWSYQNFENYTVFKSGDVVTRAKVWFGKENEVPLTVSESVIVTLPKGADLKLMRAKAVYESPILATVNSGQVVGKLILTLPDGREKFFDLVAKSSVESLSVFGKFFENIRQLLLSFIG